MTDRNLYRNPNNQTLASSSSGEGIASSGGTNYDRNSDLNSRDSEVLLPYNGLDRDGILGAQNGLPRPSEDVRRQRGRVQGQARFNGQTTGSYGRSSSPEASGLDAFGLFRKPIKFKQPSAGQMVNLATEKAAEKDDIGASNQRKSDFMRDCPDNYGGTPWGNDDLVDNSQRTPKYGLKFSIFVGITISIGFAVGYFVMWLLEGGR